MEPLLVSTKSSTNTRIAPLRPSRSASGIPPAGVTRAAAPASDSRTSERDSRPPAGRAGETRRADLRRLDIEMSKQLSKPSTFRRDKRSTQNRRGPDQMIR
ncbi:hypothetical protein KM043_008826 [Ampulex compressa]|nr:hypothetical protein KM043_008826 [Ampulex compressa]